MAEELQNPSGLLVQHLHRLEQRGLGVESLTGPGDKRGGNAEGSAIGVLYQIGRTSHIPCGVATSGVGGPDTAVGEGGGVRFSLNQGLALEL